MSDTIEPAGPALVRSLVTDYYALAGIASLFMRPGYDLERGLTVFQAIAERIDVRTGPPPHGDVPYPYRYRLLPSADYLCCRGFGTRPLAHILDWPYEAARRYSLVLEEAGIIAPLGADGHGGATGWCLDLDAVRQAGAFLALASA